MELVCLGGNFIVFLSLIVPLAMTSRLIADHLLSLALCARASQTHNNNKLFTTAVNRSAGVKAIDKTSNAIIGSWNTRILQTSG